MEYVRMLLQKTDFSDFFLQCTAEMAGIRGSDPLPKGNVLPFPASRGTLTCSDGPNCLGISGNDFVKIVTVSNVGGQNKK